MKSILLINITQHDSLKVFSKLLTGKSENSHYKNVRTSNTDYKLLAEQINIR